MPPSSNEHQRTFCFHFNNYQKRIPSYALYGKDHTTIIYHCLKHGVVSKPKVVRILEKLHPSKPAPPEKKVHKYDYIFNEPRNPGKSYKEYLAEAMERPDEKAYREKYRIFDIPVIKRQRDESGRFVISSNPSQ